MSFYQKAGSSVLQGGDFNRTSMRLFFRLKNVVGVEEAVKAANSGATPTSATVIVTVEGGEENSKGRVRSSSHRSSSSQAPQQQQPSLAEDAAVPGEPLGSVEVGRTETLDLCSTVHATSQLGTGNTHSNDAENDVGLEVQWAQSVGVDFVFEQKQVLQFTVQIACQSPSVSCDVAAATSVSAEGTDALGVEGMPPPATSAMTVTDQGGAAAAQLTYVAAVELASVICRSRSGAMYIPLVLRSCDGALMSLTGLPNHRAPVLLCNAVEQCVGSFDLLGFQLHAEELASRNAFDGASNTFVTVSRCSGISQSSLSPDAPSEVFGTSCVHGLSDDLALLEVAQRTPKDEGEVELLWQSRTVVGSLRPVWDPVPPLRLMQLVGDGGDLDQPTVLIQVFQQNAVKSCSCMGRLVLTVNELLEASQRGRSFPLRKMEKRHKHYGAIFVRNARLETRPSFTEFLSAGYEVNLTIGIDCTASNGDWHHESSYHHFHQVSTHREGRGNGGCEEGREEKNEGESSGPLPALSPSPDNAYIHAIRSVGDILMQYDSDKRVKVFGFGAVLPGSLSVSHLFNISLDPDQAAVRDVSGVVDAYTRCIPQISLAGPTRFAPCIRRVTADARKTGVYTVLMLITDGDIADMDDTTDAVVAADDAPLSIIIVGLGDGSSSRAPFERMVELDCDDGLLRARSGRVSRRDVVQFVPLARFSDGSKTALAREVLMEVPGQFAVYAQLARLPLPVRSASNSAAVSRHASLHAMAM